MSERTRRLPIQIAAVAAAVMRALAGVAPAALLNVSVVRSEEVVAKALVANIPGQPLAQALAAFANQTGFQIVYVSGVVEHQRSRVVHAGVLPQDALPRLLRGTGLTYEFLTAHSIRILRRVPSPGGLDGAMTDELPEDIVVTANRRDETLQSVPITIQVLTGETLSNLNATTFDDFVTYLPGVTAHGVGPAQNSIYVRGLATTEFANQGAGTDGPLPNVAIYLDEQSAQLPGRNLDIYAVDLDRIEVLEGPQGTLFGAGAEAGAIRYITNKPKLDVTEGVMDARYALTAHGAPSSAIAGVINIPLVADTLAVRGVIYSDRRGGYIDNVPATFARAASDASIEYANDIVGGHPAVPPNSVVITNAALVAMDINQVTYQGARLQALYQFTDSWSALLAQTYQSMEADGVFAETTADSLGVPQAPLTTQLFNPSYDKDRFENTAVTVNGRAGSLNLLYAGAFSVRNVDQVQDYTNYARGGGSVDYYQCVNPGPTAATAQCFSPSSTWQEHERNSHESHELRLSTSGESLIRGVGGVFYENYRLYDRVDWLYLTALPYFNPIAPPTGYYVLNGQVQTAGSQYATNAVFVPGTVTSNDPNVRPSDDAFFNDTTRGYDQSAAYASVDWDLVPHSLTFTSGTRYFRSTVSEVGSTVGSGGCSLLYLPVPNPCVNREATDLNALGLERTYTGFKSRAGLTWKVSDSAMLYATWSQGFRPGGFNRGFQISYDSPLAVGKAPVQTQATLHRGFMLPLAYAPDTLTNTEFGWRSDWLAGRLQWNGTAYQENWTNAQVDAAGPEFGGAGATINGGTYRVRGLETSAGIQVTKGVTINAYMAWNHGKLVREATYYWNDGTPINFAALQFANGSKVPNFGGTRGSPLSGAPPLQATLRARYEIEFDAVHVSFQVAATHQAQSLASTTNASVDVQGKAGVYELAPFNTVEASLGVAKDGWNVQAYGDNLTDTRAPLFADYYNFVKTVTTNRPRTIGLRLSYKFAGI